MHTSGFRLELRREVMFMLLFRSLDKVSALVTDLKVRWEVQVPPGTRNGCRELVGTAGSWRGHTCL